MAFGLPYVLTVSKPIQPAKGLSSYAAAAEKGIPAILAEAGGVGQMQEEAVELLFRGVINVMRHLGMIVCENTLTSILKSRTKGPEPWLQQSAAATRSPLQFDEV